MGARATDQRMWKICLGVLRVGPNEGAGERRYGFGVRLVLVRQYTQKSDTLQQALRLNPAGVLHDLVTMHS